ncbi:UNC93-like protein [Folsomia candida]|uniref:UNC93-like protein n=1 Tax=Folsomia candida TaxID=158441 RepID=A0A226DNE6_FOLCA|nr:UNC93-like protein [Folsomia candida]
MSVDKGGSVNPGFVPEENDVDRLPSSGGEKTAVGTGNTPHMEYGPGEKVRMLKNLIVICIAFMLLFTAFQSMASLQNSLNNVDGLGTYSLSVLYGSLVVSSMFLPTFLIQKFTVKWTLSFAVFGYSVYIAAQFYAEFYTLIPAAVVVGICAAPLWSAKCTYLTHLGHQYAELVHDNSQVIIVRFFGVFFLFFQSASVWGQLISSAVLSQDTKNCTNDASTMCGVKFCPDTEFCEDPKDDDDKENNTTLYILASIYLACSLAAVVVIVLLLDPLIRYGERERQGAASTLTGKSLFIATFRHMRKPYQIMLIPITIWSGMEQGFFGAEFTTGWVDCAWGIEKIGYVLVCYGVCDAVASVSFGPLIRYVGRLPIFIFGAAASLSSSSHGRQIVKPPLSSSSSTQINAFYGVIFPQDEEAAFSNYRLWESVGFILAYVFSNVLCVRPKLWILVGVITVGMAGYFIIESKEFSRKKNDKNKKSIH